HAGAAHEHAADVEHALRDHVAGPVAPLPPRHDGVRELGPASGEVAPPLPQRAHAPAVLAVETDQAAQALQGSAPVLAQVDAPLAPRAGAPAAFLAVQADHARQVLGDTDPEVGDTVPDVLPPGGVVLLGRGPRRLHAFQGLGEAVDQLAVVGHGGAVGGPGDETGAAEQCGALVGALPFGRHVVVLHGQQVVVELIVLLDGVLVLAPVVVALDPLGQLHGVGLQ